MAASDAKPLPIKNQAYRITFPIFDADGDLSTGAGGLDSEVSKDGAAFADCTNEAVEIGNGIYYLDLTSTEMNADTVAIVIKTSTSGYKNTPIILYPAENTDIPVNVTAVSGDTTAADNLEADYDGTGFAKTNSSIGTATNLTTNNDKTGYALTSSERTSIADAVLGRNFASVSGAASRSLLNAARFLRNKWSVSAGTLTVTQEDDSTTAWTGAVTTDSGADPVTSVDPT